MKVQFIPLIKSKGRRVITITQWPVILTRSSQADLSPEAHTISEPHCRIDEVDGLLMVQDLGSQYGTFVNEKRIDRAYLWPGDKLTLGLGSFLVHFNLTRCCVKARSKAAGGIPPLASPAGRSQESPFGAIVAAG